MPRFIVLSKHLERPDEVHLRLKDRVGLKLSSWLASSVGWVHSQACAATRIICGVSNDTHGLAWAPAIHSLQQFVGECVLIGPSAESAENNAAATPSTNANDGCTLDDVEWSPPTWSTDTFGPHARGAHLTVCFLLVAAAAYSYYIAHMRKKCRALVERHKKYL